MISDTLSLAAAEIRQYLEQWPDRYIADRADIANLLSSMDRICAALGNPPQSMAPNPHPQPIDSRRNIRGFHIRRAPANTEGFAKLEGVIFAGLAEGDELRTDGRFMWLKQPEPQSGSIGPVSDARGPNQQETPAP